MFWQGVLAHLDQMGAVVFKRIPVTRTEWGLFGLRWVIPASLLIFTLLAGSPPGQQRLMLIMLVGIGAILSNLLVAILLVSNYWAGFVVVVALAVDTIVCGAIVYLMGVQQAWLGLVPVMVAGLYFGWMAGLALGAGMAAALVGLTLFSMPHRLDLPLLALAASVLTAAGPLAALLTNGQTLLSGQRVPKQPHEGQQPGPVSRRATDYMSVVYDMAEVLSASKLDPNRVLISAVDFGLEGLQRVGVKPPLSSAILLFASEREGLETVLRVARASHSFSPVDQAVAVPGVAGAIGHALRGLEPAVADAPGADPELSQFERFRACQSVLCLPLTSGQETYGVMLIGSHEARAFRDIHVQLMRAVANQAAASLNNAKLYVALREQRDRIVEVEKAARAHLAAELHDGPTQSMSALTMRLNYTRRLLDKNPAEAMSELYQIEDLARRTTKEVRAMLFELRPKSLEKGLGAGLQQLAATMKDTYNQNIEVQIIDQCDQLLDTHTALTLFSVATEAAANARKHAEADLLNMTLAVHQDMLVMGIEDNGRGFDVEQALAATREREGHLGLINLQERAALVEGSLHIDSAPGQGTRLAVAIPLEVLRQRKVEELHGYAPE